MVPEWQKRSMREQSKRPHYPIYIPVDFHVDSISDKLSGKGFDPNKRTLSLMEGLVMYLNGDAVEHLFKLLCDLSSPESIVIFDYVYASVLRKENIYYGEKSIYDKVKSVRESWQFGIEKGDLEKFIRKFGFHLVANLTPEDLENRYFTDGTNTRIGKVNGTHCIAHIGK
jgi:methyltransferase (TIGR00027 family)